MINYNYSLIELENIIITQGLEKYFHKELSVNKGNYSIEDIQLIINNIIYYRIQNSKPIKNLETFGIGSWMLQFVFNSTYIELHELKKIEKGINFYEFDLSNSITFLKEQVQLCQQHDVEPRLSFINQKIAVSKDIYNGSEVNAVRYEAPGHMTGWYLTSNDFNGDVKELLTDHLFHLIINRRDLVKYLALPIGYRFFISHEKSHIWYDTDVLLDS